MKHDTYREIEIPDHGLAWIVAEMSPEVIAAAQAANLHRGDIWTNAEIKLLTDLKCPRDIARQIANVKRDMNGVVSFTTNEPGLFDTAPVWKTNAHKRGGVTLTTQEG
jgi:hypothetical protein